MTRLELIQMIRNESGMHYMSYGGRGSFGDKWPAFQCDTVTEFAAEALYALELLEGEELKEALSELQDLFNSAETDSLGRGMVVYWRIALDADHDLYVSDEYEDDEDEREFDGYY